MKIGLATRLKIVGVEVIGLGTFLLSELALSIKNAATTNFSPNFSWDYAIIGVLLIVVGFEILSLIKDLPKKIAKANP